MKQRERRGRDNKWRKRERGGKEVRGQEKEGNERGVSKRLVKEAEGRRKWKGRG
jgi:hypothetical protein